MLIRSLTLVACLLPLTASTPTSGHKRDLFPTVVLPHATVIGSSTLGIDSFKGIPYAQPPVGALRLKPPQPITSNLGMLAAVEIPRGCPQFYSQANTSALPASVLATLLNTPLFQQIQDSGEDCLTINVQRPSSASPASKLPVLFWIFGGGFETGATQEHDATNLISTSISLGKPIIYVAVNYRLGGFGFLPGSEVLADGSSNLGLLDQRLGLQWVADNIAAFGGDPTKLTIWGQSSGSISVFDQMALYGGEYTYKNAPLFRAAIMDSGSIVPADPVDCPKGQVVYDQVVAAAGCSTASDTLACLRTVDYATFLTAANSVPALFSYGSLALSYTSRPDGIVLPLSPELLATRGQYAPVPFIIGDQEDEGTLFSLMQSNISTSAEVVQYLSTYYFNDASLENLTALVAAYPDNPSAGSPFNTGAMYDLYPQYKRLAALIGDLVFTLRRRVFLAIATCVKPDVPAYSYLGSYLAGTPVVGTFHGSDILAIYGSQPTVASLSLQTYYINFITGLDPNDGTGLLPTWPLWKTKKQLLNFQSLANVLIPDTFRDAQYQQILSMDSTLRF
ncbi:carboxylic ester hydrolase-11 [Coleophoma crateriformis]|uniref:Carboxylic ester hydrolase n=1 Tax=Coleophoma crateriformis TaxID=565419 RepID=A0A3D8SA34_9HELO|nr:carboxylic ester hydrolase-11 [Coleophoma crateriformis]